MSVPARWLQPVCWPFRCLSPHRVVWSGDGCCYSEFSDSSRRSTWPSRSSTTSPRHPRFPRHLAAGARTAWRRPRGPAHYCRRADAADLAQRNREVDRPARDPLTWRVFRAIFISRCCPIGAMRLPSMRTATMNCWPQQRTVSRG
jgi:hypothetical protein